MVTDFCNLDILTDYFVGRTCTIRLAVAGGAFADTDTLATHAAVSGGGYAVATLANPVVAAINGVPAVTWDAVVWDFTGPFDNDASADMYQVYSGTDLLFENMLPVAITPVNGYEATVTPVFKLGNGTPT